MTTVSAYSIFRERIDRMKGIVLFGLVAFGVLALVQKYRGNDPWEPYGAKLPLSERIKGLKLPGGLG